MILTKSLSRFARNTVDSLKYIRDLKALRIAVIFEKENINTLETDTEMMLTNRRKRHKIRLSRSQRLTPKALCRFIQLWISAVPSLGYTVGCKPCGVWILE